MRTIEKTVYQFSELSEKAKETVLNKYRENFDFEFYSECIIENFKEKLENIGFNDVEIYYSGFSSQGDGACFTYSFIDRKLFDKFLNTLKIKESIKSVFEKYIHESSKGTHKGMYYHERSILHDVNFDFDFHFNRHPLLYEYIYSFLSEFEEYIQDYCIELSCELYSILEKQYYSCMEDSFLIEEIESNGYEYYENGQIL